MQIQFAIISIFLISLSSAVAQDWPQFRGINGTGVSPDRGLPSVFGKANLDWRLAVPFGRSSPIVAGDRIYLTALEGEKLITLAVDRKKGMVLWRREIIRDHAHKLYKGNDSASATPVADGRNVYAFFTDFGLVSYDRDGRERWRLRLGPFNNFYGVSSSPVISNGILIQVCDQRKGSFLIAVDTGTGKIRWRKERPGSDVEGFSTPVFWQENGKTQIIVSGVGRVDAYALETGENLWWVGEQGAWPIATPALGNGVLFVSGYGNASPTSPPFAQIRKRLDKNGDGQIQPEEGKAEEFFRDHFGYLDADGNGAVTEGEYEAFRKLEIRKYGLVAVQAGGRGDQTAHHLLWRYDKSYPFVTSPVLYEGVLYFVKDGGIITSMNPSKGEVWKVGRTRDALGEYFASPVAADGKLYFVSLEGKLTTVKANKQWDILAVSDLGEESYATPAVASGRIYIRTRDALYSFRAGNR